MVKLTFYIDVTEGSVLECVALAVRYLTLTFQETFCLHPQGSEWPG
jgi:hypothetical protein